MFRGKLIIVFLFFFVLPSLVFLGVQSNFPNHLVSNAKYNSKTDSFRHPVAIESKHELVELPNSTDLLPVDNQDFIVIGWFSIDKISAREKSRIVLFQKPISKSAHAVSYSLILERVNTGIRPLIYWGGKGPKPVKAAGGYMFQELQLPTKQWFMMALSYTKNRFLGLHIGYFENNPIKPGKVVVQTLGGYDLSGSSLPSGDGSLEIGGSGNAFRGMVGDVLVLSKPELGNDLGRTLKNLIKAMAHEDWPEINKNGLKYRLSDVKLDHHDQGHHNQEKSRRKGHDRKTGVKLGDSRKPKKAAK